MSIPIAGDSAFFLDLYARFRRNRNSVPADWAVHFELLDGDVGGRGAAAMHFASQLLEGYRNFGHLEATIDPLSPNQLTIPVLNRLRAAAAPYADQEVDLALNGTRRRLLLGEAGEILHSVYASRVGLQVDHLGEEERGWWYAAFESSFTGSPDEATLFGALESVALAEEFESFMRVKFPTKKRFGIEGAESAIVFLREVLRIGLEHGMQDVIIGGMHRGRLATLAVALEKSLATLMAEIMGRDLSGDAPAFTGDVPYHLGHTCEIVRGERRLRLTLLPHPSHLTVVAPVALGLTRAARTQKPNAGHALCLLLHTDAAFSGQGLAAEILQMGGLAGYQVGGAIHLVVNNQIGFTTLPSEGRSAHYCTDVGKAFGAPVLHVNGDDPLAVARAAQLALTWHQRFGKDVLIDLVCYRRYGHNELDEPRFTQPGMWSAIDGHPTVGLSFAETVDALDARLSSRVNAVTQDFRERLQRAHAVAGEITSNNRPIQAGSWDSIARTSEESLLDVVTTGIETKRLRAIGLAGCEIPTDILPHPKVRQFYDLRAEAIRDGRAINFATAEALAFGSLLAEGTRIRLSGQDSVRGTFTQRHLMVHDSKDGRRAAPLSTGFKDMPPALEVLNSPLSEYGVLGFEYGHSLFDPNRLTIWEAQFGDFLNGAQIVVDQYIATAEAKWGLMSGLVVILPHGLEGQGPDHSSARIERLTQVCAGGNIILAQPTTPANLFHLLRRQIHAPWRKPLFIFAPKSLLRSKAAVSGLEDMAVGTAFRSVIVQTAADTRRVRRVVLCSGKIFYDLDREVRSAGLYNDILPVRIEQIYPFPAGRIKQLLADCASADCVWLQDEAENQGAWLFARNELARSGVDSSAIQYIGRPRMAASAGGSEEQHQREQRALLERVLDVRPAI